MGRNLRAASAKYAGGKRRIGLGQRSGRACSELPTIPQKGTCAHPNGKARPSVAPFHTGLAEFHSAP
jgi:hypothetical protein